MAGRFSELMQMLLQDYMSRRRQTELAGVQHGFRQDEQQQALQNQILNSMDPQMAARLMSGGVKQVAGIPIQHFLPTEEQALGEFTKTMGGISDIGNLPADEVSTEQLWPTVSGRKLDDPRTLTDLIRTVASKKRGLEQAQVPEAITGYNEEQGRDVTRMLRPFEQVGLEYPAGPTPEQEGVSKGTSALAELETPGLVPAQASAAGRVAGAQERGKWAPDIVDTKVDYQTRIDRERAGARTTDAQMRARGVVIPLIEADAGATQLENAGTRLNLWTQTLGNIPLAAGMIGEDQQKYLNHAQSFMNLATLIMTGVTARPDEYKRYTGTLFTVQGDTPPTVVQKQRARRLFLKSVEMRAIQGQQYDNVDDMMNDILSEIGVGSEVSPLERLRQGVGR